MRIAVIIPALNEAGNIKRLIAQMPQVVAENGEVIVVDNGSTDGTGAQARETVATVILENCRGYGYACAAGVAAAQGADVMIFLDGDGSFDPQELPRLLAPIVENRADLVLGTRLLGGTETGAMPPHQLLGNRLAARLIRLLYGITITDLGPFRAIRYPLLQSLDMREMTFGYPTEMIVKAARQRARILEVPVTYHKRWSGQSKVSGTVRGTLLASYYILRVTFSRFIPNKS
jgi:glycosyltransferase involved in cell wall biosynthesis